MKGLIVCGVVGLVLLLTGSASAAPAHKLRTFEARSAAESAAYDFERRRKLDSNTVGRCKRQATRQMLCLATATGESARKVTTCRMRIKVRAVYPGFWIERANVVWRRCRSEARPYLAYPDALAAIQAAGDAFAGVPTTIEFMSRRDDLTFAGTAEWTRASVPPSEYLPTERCRVELVATFDAGAISMANEGFNCY